MWIKIRLIKKYLKKIKYRLNWFVNDQEKGGNYYHIELNNKDGIIINGFSHRIRIT
jgi:hypothetical protein